jgi:hypothetical protein
VIAMTEDLEIEMQPDKHPIVPRSDTEKQQLTNRLKRIEGQVRSLQKMIRKTAIVSMYSFRYRRSAQP